MVIGKGAKETTTPSDCAKGGKDSLLAFKEHEKFSTSGVPLEKYWLSVMGITSYPIY